MSREDRAERAHTKTRQTATPEFQDVWPHSPFRTHTARKHSSCTQVQQLHSHALRIRPTKRLTVTPQSTLLASALQASWDRDRRGLGRRLCPSRHGVLRACSGRVDQKVARARHRDLVAVGRKRHRGAALLLLTARLLRPRGFGRLTRRLRCRLRCRLLRGLLFAGRRLGLPVGSVPLRSCAAWSPSTLAPPWATQPRHREI
mmetsp:Transcript_2088/g.4526  ORF Transcript_2088/g.4526 Transcript_2088/m.4526 type:complete len:202 (+) Transcript_2088:180-785(+)